MGPDGTYSINYDDGDIENNVNPDIIQPERHQFALDQKVEVKWRRRNAYFPGRVVAVHPDRDEYDILYEDGDIEISVPYSLMRMIQIF